MVWNILQKMLSFQKQFQEKFYPIEKIKYSEIASAISSEASEIWHDTGKWWKQDQIIEVEHLKEESIDILHFLLLLWLKLGMTEEEIIKVYTAKMGVNIDRQESGY